MRAWHQLAKKRARIGGVVGHADTLNRFNKVGTNTIGREPCRKKRKIEKQVRILPDPFAKPLRGGDYWRLIMEIVIWSIVLVLFFFVVAFVFAV